MLVAVGALAALLSGCGSDGDDGVAGDGSTAADQAPSLPAEGDDATGGCALVSADEAAGIVGEEIVATTEMGTGCQWALPTAGAWYDWQSFPSEVYDENLAIASDSGGFAVRTIDGLGDTAFVRLQLSPAGAEISGETWVLVGDTAFHVRTSAAGWTADIEAAQRALAELIVERI